MPRSCLVICLLTMWVALTLPAHADTITDYTISFTTADGLSPVSGSFTYDSANPAFSNFFVTWDAVTFDLTAAANGPEIGGSGCAGEAATAAFGFAILSHALSGCGVVTYGWSATNTGTDADFQFSASNDSGGDFIEGFFSGSGTEAFGQGAWSEHPACFGCGA